MVNLKGAKTTVDRRLFIAGLSTLAVAGCAGGSGIIPGKKLQIVCPTDTGIRTQICGAGGGGGAFAASGGVNPGAWNHFRQVSQSDGSYGSFGWNDSTQVEHGGNDAAGNLLYHGSARYAPGSDYLTSTYSYAITNGPTVAVAAQTPTSVPTQGTTTFSDANSGNSGTITLDYNGDNYTAYFDVQGVPCSLGLFATDDSGLNFRSDYTNLNSGFVCSTYFSLPEVIVPQSVGIRPSIHLSQNACAGLEFAAIFLGGVALVLMIIALPEVVAGAAYVAGINGTLFGLAAAGEIASILSFVGCH